MKGKCDFILIWLYAGIQTFGDGDGTLGDRVLRDFSENNSIKDWIF
jgi:hypothetical protein